MVNFHQGEKDENKRGAGGAGGAMVSGGHKVAVWAPSRWMSGGVCASQVAGLPEIR